MCGFVACWGSRNTEFKGINRVKHRGPDNTSFWVSPSGEYPVFLGHVRLSIIDLNTQSNQPMSFGDRYHIVYNGEIYNYIELKEELLSLGHKFKTNSDTEVLLVGLINYGHNFLLKCNGMWSLCLYDSKKRKVLLARDRFGIKPLYYSFLNDGTLVCASEMKAIYDFMTDLKLNDDADRRFAFMFDSEYESSTIFKNIFKIKPGHYSYFDCDKKQINQIRWWNTLDHLVQPSSKYTNQVSEWRELFLDSVKIRMRSDVKIGSALSGGLDSSSIYCAMSHISKLNGTKNNHWANAFCAHYPGSTLDEVRWATEVCDYTGTKLNSVLIDPLNAGYSLTESIYQTEDPYLTIPLPMLAVYKSISKNNIKVTLDGHGADEMFSGYGHLASLLTPRNKEFSNEILNIIRSLETGVYKSNKTHNFLTQVMKSFKYRAGKSYFLRSLLKIITGQLSLSSFYLNNDINLEKDTRFQKFDSLTKDLYEIFHFTILPTLLRNYDKYSMSSGVEVRMPFMDWRLVTFTFSLPATSKVGNGYTKRILRDAMKGIVPDTIRLRRDKIGWNAPVHEWLSGPLKSEIDDSLSLSSSKNCMRQWKNFSTLNKPNYFDAENAWKRILPSIWKNSIK